MTDIESAVFSTVATALRAAYTGIYVAGEAVASPSSFPAVTLVEEDNSTYARTLTGSGVENHSQLMYAANAFSNLSSGKKAQCKAILALVDEQMFSMGFLRVGSGPMPAPNADSSIYRMVARYRCTAGKDEVIYRR